MNELELSCYLKCTDSSLLDFVGYRNEITMLNTINALLQARLMAIRKFSVDTTHITSWQKYAILYRQGQEKLLTMVVARIEQEISNMLRRMSKVTELAPVAPFLSIINPEYYAQQKQLWDIQKTQEEKSNSGVVTLDSVVITLNQVLQLNPRFKEAIEQLFEDIEEEQDIVMMLALIEERSKSRESKWNIFFERTRDMNKNQLVSNEEAVEELKDLYDSLFPAFTEAFPDTFSAEIYSFEALLWAEYILNNYSLDNSMFIVPI
ncbi:hypothetical protein BDC45DRAFT_445119 [Circinella umbellata]|nr:hypothetical protein BDC45DRAFT_445119 [Circinella umbellata]